jgi:hypothetical protein
MTINDDANAINRCAGKQRFERERDALDYRRKHEWIPILGLEPYQCYSCGSWHLGDDPTKGR